MRAERSLRVTSHWPSPLENAGELKHVRQLLRPVINAASPATEVVTKVVRKVISKVVRCLIRKVISTCTSSRTTLLTSLLTTLDPRSPLVDTEELATPPPVDEGDVVSETGPDPSLPTTWLEGSGPVALSPLKDGGA